MDAGASFRYIRLDKNTKQTVLTKIKGVPIMATMFTASKAISGYLGSNPRVTKYRSSSISVIIELAAMQSTFERMKAAKGSDMMALDAINAEMKKRNPISRANLLLNDPPDRLLNDLNSKTR